MLKIAKILDVSDVTFELNKLSFTIIGYGWGSVEEARCELINWPISKWPEDNILNYDVFSSVPADLNYSQKEVSKQKFRAEVFLNIPAGVTAIRVHAKENNTEVVFGVRTCADSKPCDNSEFSEAFINIVKRGEGFVPFIGSGCSSPSGILTGQQFDEYLAYVVYICVHKEPDEDPPRWNLRKSGWPKSPSAVQIDTVRDWVCDNFDDIAKDCGMTTVRSPWGSGYIVDIENEESRRENIPEMLSCPLVPRIIRDRSGSFNQTLNKKLLEKFGLDGIIQGGHLRRGISPTGYSYIVERAIRSLYDWRSVLIFLAELKEEDGYLWLGDFDSGIIDSFNVSLYWGKKPNLIHKMFCHLAEPARFRVFLTTNFDELIEDSFIELNEKINHIPVSIHGELPDPERVHSTNSIVKLHGTQWETRADYSLDESPSVFSKNRFFHYVRGYYPGKKGVDKGFLPSHLLVCGFSGADNRCIEFMKYVLDRDEHAKIFWICYSDSGVRQIEKLFGEYKKGRVVIAVTGRADLLLYELYQKLTLSLPPGGFSYQYSANIAPGVPQNLVEFTPNDELKRNSVDGNDYKSVDDLVKFFLPEKVFGERRSLFVDGNSGALSLAREISEQLHSNHSFEQIWLEMEDYQNPACLFYDLTVIISIRTGMFQVNHVEFVNKPENWASDLKFLVKSYFKIDPKKWIVVFYGRNGPGGCSGWGENNFWTTKEYDDFKLLREALITEGFSLIYCPYSESRRNRDMSKKEEFDQVWSQELGRKIVISDSIYLPAELDKLDEKEKGINLDRATPNGSSGGHMLCMKELVRGLRNKGVDHVKLLYTTTLFRQSRHYTAFLNEAGIRCPHRYNIEGKDNEWARNELAQKFINELKECGFFHEKPGGFAWAYRDVRMGARAVLEASSQDFTPESNISWKAHGHYWVADWYMRAFYATGHANPLMESLYHQYQAILSVNSFREELGDIADRRWRRYRLWKCAVCDMIKALKIGREAIRLWLGKPQAKAWFSDVEPLRSEIERAVQMIAEGLAEEDEIVKHANSLVEILIEEMNQVAMHANPGKRISKFSAQAMWLGSNKVIDCEDIISELAEKVCDRNVSTGVKTWFHKYFSEFRTDEQVYYLIQHLNEKSFEILQRQSFSLDCETSVSRKAAEQKRLADGGQRWSREIDLPSLLREDHAKQWLKVTIFSNQALSFCRFLHPSLIAFESKERIKALSYYAVGLARLGRFHEAHRRLSQASAILSKSEFQDKKVWYGLLKLRRAELFLWESQFVSILKKDISTETDLRADAGEVLGNIRKRYEDHKDCYFKLAYAKLDDAWCALEQSEELVKGKLRSPRWWALICLFKIQCLEQDRLLDEMMGSNGRFGRYKSLIHRYPNSPIEHLKSLCESGLSAALGRDELRLRIVGSAVGALKLLVGEHCQEISIEFFEILKGAMVPDTIAALKSAYGGNVDEFFNALVSDLKELRTCYGLPAS